MLVNILQPETMYKKLLLGLCAGLCTNLTTYAQYDLLSGAPPENAIVKEPYIFWDLMRDKLPSWTRYYRPDEFTAFGQSNRLIQRKDESGRFNHLETSIWNPLDNKWILLDKHIYKRSFIDSKVLSETYESWVRHALDEPLTYQKTVLNNSYQNARLSMCNNEMSSDGGVTSIGETFYIYNSLNQRIYDSSEINNLRFVDRNQFDNNNNCVFSTTYFNGNESVNSAYKYKNGFLTEVRYYGKITPDSIPSSVESYTYNASGLLTEAVLSRTVDGVLTDLYRFTHGYTETGKLKWMCNQIWENDEWMKGDSIVVSYTNEKADTSYGYLGNANNEWNSYTSFMFVFDEQMVGVNAIKNKSIDFSVLPNPANNKVSINLDVTDNINQISITDVLGKTVYENNLYNNAIDVSNLQPGVYFVSITTNRGKGQKKIIIN